MRPARRIDYDFLSQSKAFIQFSNMMLELTGMPVALFPPEGNRFTLKVSEEAQNPVCRLVQSHPEGLQKCLDCNRVHFTRVAITRTASVYPCHIGQIDIAIPVFHQGECVAVISTGQLLPDPPSDAQFQKLVPLCKTYGFSRPQLEEAYDQAHYLPPSKVRATIDLLTFFAQYLCESSQHIHDLSVRHLPDVVLQSKAYIDNHLSDDLSLEDVAIRIGFSVGYLSKRLIESLGMSFTEYVQSERLSRAKTLLRSSDEAISSISFACGFGSLSQFNRVIRRLEGVSPREYRRRGQVS